ncbi:hypothetical protein YPPY103_2065, partial [Yersinia pestis PY-103]
MSIVTAS